MDMCPRYNLGNLSLLERINIILRAKGCNREIQK